MGQLAATKEASDSAERIRTQKAERFPFEYHTGDTSRLYGKDHALVKHIDLPAGGSACSCKGLPKYDFRSFIPKVYLNRTLCLIFIANVVRYPVVSADVFQHFDLLANASATECQLGISFWVRLQNFCVQNRN